MPVLLDTNTNIMLDLETASLNSYPCIIELSATHFNFNNAIEYSHFTTPISLQSCLDAGLHFDTNTAKWLDKNIPEIYEAAKTSTISLSIALKQCEVDERKRQVKAAVGLGPPKVPQLPLWGNGVIADNKWIESAYHAVNLGDIMPWKHSNHSCVRTYVKQVFYHTGRDYSKTIEHTGKKHASLDDCRHQVRYMVWARKAMSCVGSSQAIPGEKEHYFASEIAQLDIGEEACLFENSVKRPM